MMDDLPNSPPVRPIRSIQLLLGQIRYRGPYSVRNVSQLGHQRNSQFDVWRRPRVKRPNRIPQVKHDLFLIISLARKTGPPHRRTSWSLVPDNSRSVAQRLPIRRGRLELVLDRSAACHCQRQATDIDLSRSVYRSGVGDSNSFWIGRRPAIARSELPILML